MYNIHYDSEKKRLLLRISGPFTSEEMRVCVDETIKIVNNLEPGFDVITDFTELKILAPEVTVEIARVLACITTSGARKGVRVVKKEAKAKDIQLKEIDTSVGCISVSVNSIAEAEMILSD